MRSNRHAERSRPSSRRWGRVALVGALVASLVPAATTISPGAVAAAPATCSGLGAGGEYHPLTPQRIFDSRPLSAVNDPVPGPKAANGGQPTFDIDVLGRGGIPNRPNDVLAVVVNITVTEPTAAGWLNAYGKGANGGLASIVNFSAGQTVPNLAITRPGADGDLTIRLFSTSAGGSAHVVVDVFGWFSTSCNADNGARLVPIDPGRLLDTRESGGPLGQGESRVLPIRGAQLATGAVLPAGSDIVGVVLNVTGINQDAASRDTFLSVVPELTPGTPPSTSNVNVARGQIKPNMVVVPVNAADGAVRLYNHAGLLHVAVDVVGYLTTSAPNGSTTAGRVVPLATPYRVFDTRQVQWQAVALGPGQAEDWSFADFVNSVTVDGQWLGAQSAVIGNLTSASLTRQFANTPVSSYLTVHPTDQTRPLVSNLNTTEGAPVPNLAIMKYGPNSTVRVFNLSGFSHYLFDASAVVLS